MNKLLIYLEYFLIALFGLSVLAFPVDQVVTSIPFFSIIITGIIVLSIGTATVGYLKNPTRPLPVIWITALSITGFLHIVTTSQNNIAVAPTALIILLVAGLTGKHFAWLIPFFLFTFGGTIQTILILLINHKPLSVQAIFNPFLINPFRYGYYGIAGFLPALLSTSLRVDRYILRKATLPRGTSEAVTKKINPDTKVHIEEAEQLHRTQTFTIEHLSDYNQAVQEKDVVDLLSSVVYFMSRNFRSYSALGFIFDPQKQVFTLNSSQSKSIHIIKHVEIPLGEGIVGTIGTERRSFMTGDFRVYTKELHYYSKEEQINSILAMPIISGDNELLGTLVLDSKDTHAFKDIDKDTLKRFSYLAAALITTARMRSFQERSAKTFQMFYQASHQFTTAFKAEDVFEVLFGVIPTVVPCTRQVGIVFNEENDNGKVVSVWGNSPDLIPGFTFPMNAGLYSFAFQKRKPAIINDYRQFTERYYRFIPNEPQNPSIRSLIIFPIIDDEQRCRGLFSIESDQPNIFYGDTEQVLTTLIENASVAFIRAILYQHMEQLATTDGLTGLNNHRHFQELLSREIERSRRYNRPLSLLLMDIDHFKSFNDTYGHPVGDLVLKEISQCIRHSIRQNDIPARYGGEEFVVIIPESSEKGALTIAERIRCTIEQHTIISLDRKLKVTVSIGGSSFPDKAPTQQQLIDTADRALYQAKENGRNQVMPYQKGI